MAQQFPAPKRKKSPPPGYDSDEDVLNLGDFLWEQVECHPFHKNLTEIFNTVIKSGCNLSGPESLSSGLRPYV
jgi:hypothetical protein